MVAPILHNDYVAHCEISLDNVQVTQMAKYLETVYVSGWQSSSTASSSNEPGPDLAGESLYSSLHGLHLMRWMCWTL